MFIEYHAWQHQQRYRKASREGFHSLRVRNFAGIERQLLVQRLLPTRPRAEIVRVALRHGQAHNARRRVPARHRLPTKVKKKTQCTVSPRSTQRRVNGTSTHSRCRIEQ